MSDQDADTPKKKIQWEKAQSGIVDVYANMLHVTWTIDDVRIRFAQMVTSSETRTPSSEYVGVAEERAGVTLSWRVARFLRDALISAIDKYETTNGEIRADLKLPQ